MDKVKEENLLSKDSPIFNPLFAKKIKIGKGNIFEGAVEIETAGGDIEIGNYNVFENAVRIINTSQTATISIDSFNYFEAKVIVNSSLIGNYNIMKTYSMILASSLKDCCVVAMCSTVNPGSFSSTRSGTRQPAVL